MTRKVREKGAEGEARGEKAGRQEAGEFPQPHVAREGWGGDTSRRKTKTPLRQLQWQKGHKPRKKCLKYTTSIKERKAGKPTQIMRLPTDTNFLSTATSACQMEYRDSCCGPTGCVAVQVLTHWINCRAYARGEGKLHKAAMPDSAGHHLITRQGMPRGCLGFNSQLTLLSASLLSKTCLYLCFLRFLLYANTEPLCGWKA